MTKEAVTVALQDLPDKFHIDELISKLFIVEEVEQALASYKQGDYLTNEEMAEKIREMKMRHRLDAA